LFKYFHPLGRGKNVWNCGGEHKGTKECGEDPVKDCISSGGSLFHDLQVSGFTLQKYTPYCYLSSLNRIYSI